MKISKKSVVSSSFSSDMPASRKHQVFFVSRFLVPMLCVGTYTEALKTGVAENTEWGGPLSGFGFQEHGHGISRICRCYRVFHLVTP